MTQGVMPYHFEGVQLFLDLLSQHGSETIACCNLPPPVVFHAWPSIVELDSRTEADVVFRDSSHAPCLCIGVELWISHEIVLAFDGDRVGSSMPMSRPFTAGRARSTRTRGIIDVGNLGKIKIHRLISWASDR